MLKTRHSRNSKVKSRITLRRRKNVKSISFVSQSSNKINALLILLTKKLKQDQRSFTYHRSNQLLQTFTILRITKVL
jgi:hypothetical protein